MNKRVEKVNFNKAKDKCEIKVYEFEVKDKVKMNIPIEVFDEKFINKICKKDNHKCNKCQCNFNEQ